MSIEWAELFLKHLFSWPVAIVIVALLFRKFLLSFLQDVTKAKLGPVELERKIEKVQQETEALKEINRLFVETERLQMKLSELEKQNASSAESDQVRESIASRIKQITEWLTKLT